VARHAGAREEHQLTAVRVMHGVTGQLPVRSPAVPRSLRSRPSRVKGAWRRRCALALRATPDPTASGCCLRESRPDHLDDESEVA